MQHVDLAALQSMLNVVQTDTQDKLVYVALYAGFGRKINVHLNDNRNVKVLCKWVNLIKLVPVIYHCKLTRMPICMAIVHMMFCIDIISMTIKHSYPDLNMIS